MTKKGSRSLDLIVLLMISALIVSASAAIYYAMTVNSTSTIGVSAVYFIAGGDSGGGVCTLGTNNTFARLTLSAYPNVTLYYDQAVNLTASTAGKQVQLRHVSVTPNNSPSVANFTSVVFRLIRSNGAEVGTLTYTTSGTSWSTPPSGSGFVSIANGEKLAIKVEIRAKAGSKSGVATTIEIAVDVQ